MEKELEAYYSTLNINKFIQDNGCKEVISDLTLNKSGEPDINGVFSELIFGKIGSKERVKQFGYIDLKRKYMEPFIFSKIAKLGTNIKNCALQLNTFEIDVKHGMLVEKDGGKNGIQFLYEVWDRLNLDNVKTDSNSAFIEYLKKRTKDDIFIDKWLVSPAGTRDFKKDQIGKIQYDEINTEYINLIRTINAATLGAEDSVLSMVTNLGSSEIEKNVQRRLNTIYKFYALKPATKTGVMRSMLLSKRIDFTARLILCQDKNLLPSQAGIPWFILAILFEPFLLNKVINDENAQNFLKRLVPDLNYENFHIFLDKMHRNLHTILEIEPNIKKLFISLLEQVFEEHELMVLVKRDPAFAPKQIFAAYPVIMDVDQGIIRIQSGLFVNLGGDSDGDAVNVYSLFSKVAIEEAKEKMLAGRIRWYKSENDGEITSNITNDARLGLYLATR